jgi:hypothetical protein
MWEAITAQRQVTNNKYKVILPPNNRPPKLFDFQQLLNEYCLNPDINKLREKLKTLHFLSISHDCLILKKSYKSGVEHINLLTLQELYPDKLPKGDMILKKGYVITDIDNEEYRPLFDDGYQTMYFSIAPVPFSAITDDQIDDFKDIISDNPKKSYDSPKTFVEENYGLVFIDQSGYRNYSIFTNHLHPEMLYEIYKNNNPYDINFYLNQQGLALAEAYIISEYHKLNM